MKAPLFSRLQAAWQLIRRAGGAPFPFNLVPFGQEGGGDRLDHPYRNSVWVQRAIKKVSGPISAVPLMFTLGAKQAAGDPALSTYWSKPTIGLTFASFLEATVGWLKLAGEFF